MSKHIFPNDHSKPPQCEGIAFTYKDNSIPGMENLNKIDVFSQFFFLTVFWFRRWRGSTPSWYSRNWRGECTIHKQIRYKHFLTLNVSTGMQCINMHINIPYISPSLYKEQVIIPMEEYNQKVKVLFLWKLYIQYLPTLFCRDIPTLFFCPPCLDFPLISSPCPILFYSK